MSTSLPQPYLCIYVLDLPLPFALKCKTWNSRKTDDWRETAQIGIKWKRYHWSTSQCIDVNPLKFISYKVGVDAKYWTAAIDQSSNRHPLPRLWGQLHQQLLDGWTKHSVNHHYTPDCGVNLHYSSASSGANESWHRNARFSDYTIQNNT